MVSYILLNVTMETCLMEMDALLHVQYRLITPVLEALRALHPFVLTRVLSKLLYNLT
jgi:hypothetical protein